MFSTIALSCHSAGAPTNAAVMDELKAIKGVMSNSSGSKRSRYGSQYGGLDRDPVLQAELKTILLKLYSRKCIITDAEQNVLHQLRAAHIVSLSEIAGLGSQYRYASSNGVLMEPLLEEAFDRHEWYFEADGTIVVLWVKCAFKVILENKAKISLLPEESGGPSPRVIAEKKRMALLHSSKACPDCYLPNRRLDLVRWEDHKRESCGGIKKSKRPVLCSICDVEIPAGEVARKAHVEGQKHRTKAESVRSSSSSLSPSQSFHAVCTPIAQAIQGVGFRKAIRSKARDLGIKGTVANLDGGSVQLKAYCSRDEWDALLQTCQFFLPQIVEPDAGDLSGAFLDFVILRSSSGQGSVSSDEEEKEDARSSSSGKGSGPRSDEEEGAMVVEGVSAANSCELCNVVTPGGPEQLARHLNGQKHKKKVDAQQAH